MSTLTQVYSFNSRETEDMYLQKISVSTGKFVRFILAAKFVAIRTSTFLEPSIECDVYKWSLYLKIVTILLTLP